MSSNQQRLGNKFVNRATSASMRKTQITSYEITGAGPVKSVESASNAYKDETKLNTLFKPNGSGGGMTEGTADTMHKTFDSERVHNTDMRMKPPRSDINKVRPQTGNPTSANFYRHKAASKEVESVKSAHGVISLSVDRNKIQSRSGNHHSMGGHQSILDNYQIGKPIGQGAYATVYACYHKMNMRKFAIKIYQKSKLNDSMKRKAVQREIMALKKIDHPHIIKMYDLIETSK